MVAGADRRAFDTSSSGQAQANLHQIIGQLETLIAARHGHVQKAMSDFTADGVSDDYHGKETQWHGAANEVQGIIDLLKGTLVKNDDTAGTAQTAAKNAVNNMV
ncbi:MAG: hypothetical protein JWM76_509 [Pseudonocardiales bacterium]|nr:hypothetical protein [Pseudonocardiales bacterium]